MPPDRTHVATPALAKGSKFASLKAFKEAAKEYARQQHFDFIVKKSNSDYVLLLCKVPNCDFRARAHVCTKDPSVTVLSTFNPEHTCAGALAAKRSTTNEHRFLVDSQSVNKARLAIIGSNDAAQLAEFKQIEAWLQAVQQQDSGSHTAHMPVNGKFARAFVCPSAAIAAWPHCKPFVAVDGTFTKNRYGMVLLLAATMDANSSLIILAWALVPVESQDTWEWFLQHLAAALPTIAAATTTIISDRQKGLLNAIKEVLPAAVEGYCCWHLAENVKTHFGAEARKLFWKLVYAETRSKFHTSMTSLKAVKPEAATYLSDAALPHKFWASYAFPGRRFGHVTSNLSEIANSALRFQRELPPLQLMTAIYSYEMEHFHSRAQKANMWNQVLAPQPHTSFIEALDQSRRHKSVPASPNSGLVMGSDSEQYKVTLAKNPRTEASVCTCGVPELMLFPCSHVCAMAAALKKTPLDYAWGYWRTLAWRNTYAKPYVVVAAVDLSSNQLEAPASKAKRGRPQKARREAGKGFSSTASSSSRPAMRKHGCLVHNLR